MTTYIIQLFKHGTWHTAPAPASDSMLEAFINGELWFPTERIRVVPYTKRH